ncbi:MAG: MMPL family transporter [Candidatus Dormibacteria bacterium]
MVGLLAAAPTRDLLGADDMVAMAKLEGQLAALPGVSRVYGPGTLVNVMATEVTQRALDLCNRQGQTASNNARGQAAADGKSQADQDAAANAAYQQAVHDCATSLAQQFPTLGVPALNNPSFVREVLADPAGGTRPYWRFAMPDPAHAVITVRMSANASSGQVQSVLTLLRSAPQTVTGASVIASGAPALTAAVSDQVVASLTQSLPLALAVMFLVLLLVLRVPMRLLAVPLAALAALWAAGAAGFAGLPLTPATLAVIPVVLGLTVDYSVQSANRLVEEGGAVADRVERAGGAVARSTLLAAVATAAGVSAFILSPVPLLRQFGLFLAIGVGAAWLAAVAVGLPATAYLLTLWTRPRVGRPPSWPALARLGRTPGVLAGALLLAGLGGWAALPRLTVETDPARLLPAGGPALADASRLQSALGSTGELDLVLTGPDVTSPAALDWLSRAEGAAVRSAPGQLTAVASLPDLLSGLNGGQMPDPSRTRILVQRLPAYFTGAVVSGDHHLARAALGLTRLQSVADDRALLNRLAALPPPPAGYRWYPAGLAVVASAALTGFGQDQVRLDLVALALVLVVLVAAYRNLLRALLALLPAASAGGAAVALLAVAPTRTSPLGLLSAGVVVAFATEFSVLWLARYGGERSLGTQVADASEIASRRVGPAMVASGLALAAGFLVLAVSPVPMVRDFGLTSAVALALATLAALGALPPLARAWLR